MRGGGVAVLGRGAETLRCGGPSGSPRSLKPHPVRVSWYFISLLSLLMQYICSIHPCMLLWFRVSQTNIFYQLSPRENYNRKYAQTILPCIFYYMYYVSRKLGKETVQSKVWNENPAVCQSLMFCIQLLLVKSQMRCPVNAGTLHTSLLQMWMSRWHICKSGFCNLWLAGLSLMSSSRLRRITWRTWESWWRWVDAGQQKQPEYGQSDADAALCNHPVPRTPCALAINCELCTQPHVHLDYFIMVGVSLTRGLWRG